MIYNILVYVSTTFDTMPWAVGGVFLVKFSLKLWFSFDWIASHEYVHILSVAQRKFTKSTTLEVRRGRGP